MLKTTRLLAGLELASKIDILRQPCPSLSGGSYLLLPDANVFAVKSDGFIYSYGDSETQISVLSREFLL